MPDLNSTIHLDMLRSSPNKRSLARRIARAVKKEITSPDVYGMEWGDPARVPPLAFVRANWVLPYVKPSVVALEIGPGGGRWTKYLLGCRQVYAVDYHQELLDELLRRVHSPKLTPIKNHGTDFPGVPDQSIDLLFSFGVFVHLEVDLISGYLKNMARVLKPGANVIIHYADQHKVMAQVPGFAKTDPEQMRALVTGAGYQIVQEDLGTLWHSALIRFTP